MNGCGCNGSSSSSGGWPQPILSLQLAGVAARIGEPAVLGPNLGGGIVPTGQASGLGRTGGGVRPSILYAVGFEPANWPQVRRDFLVDFTTPGVMPPLPGGPAPFGGLS